MAKRKRRKKSRFKFKAVKDYRSEAYVMYIAHIEIGILQAGTIFPELTDGDVAKSLDDLIYKLKDPETLPQLLAPEATDDQSETKGNIEAVQYFIALNLRDVFEEHGPLDAADVSGILKVIKSSVNAWNIGMRRRGYLEYIEGFLGQLGVEVRQVSEEEIIEMGLDVGDFE